MRGSCSICNSRVAAEINAALANHEKLRDLEKRSGFSRASLSRHSRNCIPRTRLAQHRSAKSIGRDIRNGRRRLLVHWPEQNGKADYYQSQQTLAIIPETDLLASDIIIRVQYEKLEVHNPLALFDQAKAEMLADFASRSPQPIAEPGITPLN